VTGDPGGGAQVDLRWACPGAPAKDDTEVAVDIEVESVTPLRFDDGAPVRAASAIAHFGGGWLIAQDDATHAAWLRNDSVTPVRVLPAVDGHDLFGEAAGTKHLKPDFEAACEVVVGGENAVLMLGSGSKPERMRAALVRMHDGEPHAVAADLSPLYATVAQTLAVDAGGLNMEGACGLGDSLRWFQRGLPEAGLPTASVDLDLAALLAAITEGADVAAIEVSEARTYDLGEVHSVGLGVTDVVHLSDDRLLVSSAAEDTPNPRDDGPVVGAALAMISGAEVQDMTALPDIDGQAPKVEGLSIIELHDRGARVLATVDADDPDAPSLAVTAYVRW
jgi:hypothetical protein